MPLRDAERWLRDTMHVEALIEASDLVIWSAHVDTGRISMSRGGGLRSLGLGYDEVAGTEIRTWPVPWDEVVGLLRSGVPTVQTVTQTPDSQIPVGRVGERWGGWWASSYHLAGEQVVCLSMPVDVDADGVMRRRVGGAAWPV